MTGRFRTCLHRLSGLDKFLNSVVINQELQIIRYREKKMQGIVLNFEEKIYSPLPPPIIGVM